MNKKRSPDDTRDPLLELEQHIRRLEEELAEARQESEDANRNKMMFLANMSHEIRTPMNSILGIYNLLKNTSLTEEQSEFLEIINIASQNLLIIIDDILDLSRIEAGQLKFEFRSFDLMDEIRQVIKLLSLKAKGKGITLYSNIEASVPAWVIGDAVRLKQILINLASNAIKYTNEGEVQIAIEVLDPALPDFGNRRAFVPDGVDPGTLKPDEKILMFSVIDTGIGISTEDQETLFYAFSQLENPLIRRFEGSGLGLSISRNLTYLMNGKMGVISEMGKGSTFWFTLVMEAGDRSRSPGGQETTRSGIHKTRKLSVLLVEDNLLNQKFAQTALKREGHEIDLAANGIGAVEKFREKTYDLILMDIAMPVMDGLEAARSIRQIESERLKRMTSQETRSFTPVRIVAITAHIMMADKEKCIEAGMDDFLAKPYRPFDLMKIIDGFRIT